MKLDIEINFDIFNDYIGVEIFYIFAILLYSDLFYIGNWENWNLIRKNIFQFIELITAKIIIFSLKKCLKVHSI